MTYKLTETDLSIIDSNFNYMMKTRKTPSEMFTQVAFQVAVQLRDLAITSSPDIFFDFFRGLIDAMKEDSERLQEMHEGFASKVIMERDLSSIITFEGIKNTQ